MKALLFLLLFLSNFSFAQIAETDISQCLRRYSNTSEISNCLKGKINLSERACADRLEQALLNAQKPAPPKISEFCAPALAEERERARSLSAELKQKSDDVNRRERETAIKKAVESTRLELEDQLKSERTKLEALRAAWAADRAQRKNQDSEVRSGALERLNALVTTIIQSTKSTESPIASYTLDEFSGVLILKPRDYPFFVIPVRSLLRVRLVTIESSPWVEFTCAGPDNTKCIQVLYDQPKKFERVALFKIESEAAGNQVVAAGQSAIAAYASR